MKQRVFLAFAAVVLALPARAVPISPDDEQSFVTCDAGHLNVFPFSNGEDNFGPVHMALPRSGAIGVPRNVELILGGFLNDLDFVPPFLVVKLLDPDHAEVPSTRSGALLRPAVTLAPHTTYRVAVRLADPTSCEGCDLEQDFPFTTGADPDHVPPAYAAEPFVQALVLSDADRQCGFGGAFGTTHLLLGRMPELPPDVARLSIAVRPGNGTTTRATDLIVRGATQHFFRGGTEQVALDDEIIIAVTPIDLAGNAGAAVSVRVRARPFEALRDAPFEELDDRQCALPFGVRAALPDTVPTNARFLVEMPVEPVPMGLVLDGATIPLHPTEHLPGGQVLEPTSPLPSGRTLQLVSLPCAHCACVGCDVSTPTSFTVGDSADDEPPAAPVVLGFVEDLDPAPAEDLCHPDRTALIALLERGDDDKTPAAHLRYDAVLRVGDQLSVEAGRALPVVLREDGTAAVRLETAAYGRLLTEPFELELTARDLAGNRSSTSVIHDAGEAGFGCASSRVPRGALPLPAALLLSFLGWISLRKRAVR